MRQVALLLLLAVPLGAGAAEIWRWTDANGVVHYSDQPRPGAERVTVNVSRPSGVTEQPAPPDSEMPAAAAAPPPRVAPLAYTTCIVSSPANDEVFQGVQDINVSLAIEPELQPGHRIQVTVNGVQRVDWPTTSTSHTLAEVFRGSHTVQVRILDAGGRVLCAGPGVTFHLRQQSVLSPASPLAPRPNAPRGGG